MGVMEFEFDPEKSKSNQQKHGMDFIDAQALWDDPDLIEIPARTTGEPRWLVVGRIGGKHWAGIITYRGEAIRLVSVRKARPEEVELYES